MAELKTAGTHLFLLDPEAATPAPVKFKCPTGITGATAGARSRIDTTCLDEEDSMSYVAGLADANALSVPFVLDPTALSHQQLFELKKSSKGLLWYLGFSDGKAAPTVAAKLLVAPAARSGLLLPGYIADLDIDVANNEVVRGTMTIQRTGAYTATWKTVAVA